MFLTHPEGEPDAARLREHEADFTPWPVALQCVAAAAGRYTRHRHEWRPPARVLDPMAGAGVWLKAMNRVLRPEYSVAIDVREEEREHLTRHAEEVRIGDAFDLIPQMPRFDIACTNPAFSRFFDLADLLLSRCRWVWLFAPVDGNIKGEAGSRWFKENAKYVERCLWVPGGLSFREGGGGDFRSYGLWMLTDHAYGSPKGWDVEPLPRLPGSSRKWKTRPGTEGE